MSRESAIAGVRAGFARTPHPGDAFLQGSSEGSEPSEVAQAFSGVADWADIDATTLDTQYTALSFLSEGGFRFFMPAFLVADLEGRLQTADPVFELTHGFLDTVIPIPTKSGTHLKRIGSSAFVNPRRYGAMTWHDYARSRLSVFSREEAAAIVGYLEHRKDVDDDGIDTPAIEAALASFWRERAVSAPSQDNLISHIEAEEAYLRDVT